MSQPVKRRVYDSPRRREQARSTRSAVLDSAAELFIERGYGATTIDAIASRANVSPETVYATFGTKRSLIAHLVDISIAGGDDAAPVLEQAWVAEMRDEPNPARRLRILAQHGVAILARRAMIDEVVHGAAAADRGIAELRERGKAQRLAGQHELLRIVVDVAGLRADLDLATAADILYAIGSPEVYRLLVGDRGWSEARFVEWYGDALIRLLLAAPEAAPSRTR